MSTLQNFTATHSAPRARRDGFFVRLSAMWATTRQRRQLRDMDDAILHDIGLTRAQADAESRRAPWDVPSTWLR